MPEQVIDLIEKQEWLEPIADALQQAGGRAYDKAGPVGRRLKNSLHGTWLGHPLHPALTDVPLGAWTTSTVLDLLDEFGGRDQYARAADAAICVGLTGASVAALAGLTDWRETYGGARRLGLAHGLLNIAAVSLFTTSWILRKRKQRPAGRALSLAGYAVGCLSAWLGGHLVYSERIGVDHTSPEPLPPDWLAILDEAALPEGQPRRVDAHGAPVVLVKQNGRIYAIGEVCSHLGGPLAEGSLEGDSIRCPWHGSRFSLADGRVLDGPATHAEPCLETRVRDGRIEVRQTQQSLTHSPAH